MLAPQSLWWMTQRPRPSTAMASPEAAGARRWKKDSRCRAGGYWIKKDSSAGKAKPTGSPWRFRGGNEPTESRWRFRGGCNESDQVSDDSDDDAGELKKVPLTRRQRSYLNLYMSELKYGTAEAQFLEKLAQKMGGHPQASQMAQWKG